MPEIVYLEEERERRGIRVPPGFKFGRRRPRLYRLLELCCWVLGHRPDLTTLPPRCARCGEWLPNEDLIRAWRNTGSR